jgi:hypothetical protein
MSGHQPASAIESVSFLLVVSRIPLCQGISLSVPEVMDILSSSQIWSIINKDSESFYMQDYVRGS